MKFTITDTQGAVLLCSATAAEVHRYLRDAGSVRHFMVYSSKDTEFADGLTATEWIQENER